MRYNIFYLLFISITAVISLTNCSKDEVVDPPEENIPYFSIKAEKLYLMYGHDHWVVVTNDKGEVLDFQNLTAEGDYEFIEHSNELSEELGVYLFSISDFNDIYSINGYLNIPRGDIWSLKTRKGYGQYGIVNIRVSNFPSTWTDILLPANNNTGGFSYNGMEEIDLDPWDGIADTVIFPLPIIKDSDTLIITNALKDNDPRYLRISGVSPGQSYEFDFFEDFVPYDKIVNYQIQDEGDLYYTFVAGIQSNDIHYLTFRYKTHETKFTQLGYINGFDFYNSTIKSKNYKGFSVVSFFKRGEPIDPNEIQFPQNDFQILNSSISNFSYEASEELVYRKSEWNKPSDRTYLTIYEKTSGSFKQLSSVPFEINDLYPYVKLSDLQYRQSEFFDVVENYSYEEFIKEKFRDSELETKRHIKVGYLK